MILRGSAFESLLDINHHLGGFARVLVLNRSYWPIHITTVRRAVSLLCLEIAHGIDRDYQTYSWEDLLEVPPTDTSDHEDFYFLRTINQNVAVPKVIILAGYDERPPQNVRFSRSHIFLRDSHTCQYCGTQMPRHRLNLDHVVPRTQGGKTTWENIVTSCHGCNRKKGGRTPAQAGMRLLSHPHKPSMAPAMFALKHHRIPSWYPFISHRAPEGSGSV